MGKMKEKVERMPFEVEHEGRIIHFVSPHFGSGNSKEVGLEIERYGGLRKPTFGETISLVHASLMGLVSEDLRKQISYVLNHNMWGYTATVFDGGGIKVRGRRTTGGFVTAMTSPGDVRVHHYLVLLGGKEGAEKIAELIDRKKISNVDIGAPAETEGLTTRPGALAIFTDGLSVNYSRGHERNGYAFGILEG